MADLQFQPSQTDNWKWKALLFLSGQTVSLFGSSLVQYAIVWYITLTSGSGIVMTISTLCSFFAPNLYFPVCRSVGGPL